MVDVDVSSPAAARHTSVVRIQRRRRLLSLDVRELWQYRELLAFFVWRDIKIRYKQTFLGAGWAIGRPFASMVIFTIVFGHLAGIKGDTGIPYPLFVFAGLLPWTYFSSALVAAAGSVVGSAGLISKAYFPRLLLPMSSVVTPLVDLVLSSVVLVGVFAWYRTTPPWFVPLSLAFLALTVLAAFGFGVGLSAINVRYRDVVFAVPFVIQIWLYLTPVIYPGTLVPRDLRWLLAINPLTGAIEGFRWSVVGGTPPSVLAVAASAAISLAMCVLGLLLFRRVEQRFADVI